ncbi:RtcB family protein [Paraburkholderia terrae]|uniref:RtcB family protein n=1 Tax=Paraburkholderia terrae TaxID=311230 RepID=UPI0030E03644
MSPVDYQLMEVASGKAVKMWAHGVAIEEACRRQLRNMARMPFVFRHVAVMPDAHVGKGSTIGSVIPTQGAIIPAAVGVDIGCGMMAVRTTLTAADLPASLSRVRSAIERAVPHGGAVGRRDPGAWSRPPPVVDDAWKLLAPSFQRIVDKYPSLARTNNHAHVGTLGSGNHFIEVCLDGDDRVWFMLHSGSRGVGNAIGSLFITLAQADMRQHLANLPDKDLAYFREGSRHFDDYVEAVGWAQQYARCNREVMMNAVIDAVRATIGKPFTIDEHVVNCHHNYVQKERHFGVDIFVTRKGALSARAGEFGIVPGSMGAKSFIVRGLGNEESFCSCSHGAGRAMSRKEAKRRFTVQDQISATEHVECRKDAGVIDEIPMAYKDIDAVMTAQRNLVEVVHTLRQVVCVKG